MKRTQRVDNLINSFMDYHNQGYSIQEIAQKLNVSNVTVYSHLDEIAKKYGKTREDLLKVVHPNERIDKGFSRKSSSVNSEELLESLKSILNETNCLIKKISESLKEEK